MPKVLNIPFVLGRKDSVEGKFGPTGAMATAQNLRVRKDGRLAARLGYSGLNMSSTAGAVAAKIYDLTEYRDRLVGFGSNNSDGYPTSVFEYTGIAAGGIYWKKESGDIELTPFADLIEIDSQPTPSSGVDQADCSSGAGYICSIVRSDDDVVVATIIKESNNQTIYSEVLSTTRSTRDSRVIFSVDTFYVMSQRADNSIDILSFKPETDASFQLLVSGAFALNATAAVYDICPVENPSTARFVVVMDRGVATSTTIRVYNSSGSAVGSDITIAGLDTIALSICSDQTANVIHLSTVVTGNTHTLRTYNYSGALTVGATTLASGTHTAICRSAATAAPGSANHIMVAIATAAGDTLVNARTEAAHTSTFTRTCASAIITTRLLPWRVAASISTANQHAVVFGGYVSPVISSTTSASNAIFLVSGIMGHMALRDYTTSLPRTYRNIGLSYDSTNGKVSWLSLSNSGTGNAQARISTFTKQGTMRRQTVKFANLMYIAGAPMQVYDGRFLYEPFQELPGIVSVTASNSTGTLTNSATYSYVVHWEITLSDGSLWQSAPSVLSSVTMGAADDTNTLVVSTPHHTSITGGSVSYGAEIIAVVSRTVWDSATGTQQSEFRRCVTKTVPIGGTGSTAWGATLSIVDTVPDSTLATQEVLYTQASRGVNSGTLEHNASRPCRYLTATESRLITGGTLARSELQVSKESFLGEPFTFSEFSTFFAQIAGRVIGVHSRGQDCLVFTKDAIYLLSGPFPTDLGGTAINPPVRLSTQGGLEDWRSILEGPDGSYFQLDDNKLYKIQGTSTNWEGVDIQTTLNSFPTITGACKHKRDDVIMFACNNAGLTSARIIVRSMRTGLWTEDTPNLTTNCGIEAICAFGDTVAYTSGGAVFVQSTTSYADDLNSVVTTWQTNPIYPAGLGGYCTCQHILLTSEFQSAGTLAAFISYDDGANFTTYPTFTVSALFAGQTVQKRWALEQTEETSVVIKFTWSPLSNGEGLIINGVDLQYEVRPGALKELPASDCA